GGRSGRVGANPRSTPVPSARAVLRSAPSTSSPRSGWELGWPDGIGRGARGAHGGEFDGWAIARRRIAKEARERTGKLDLVGLGLGELPPEVTGLTHLRELDL